MSSIALSLLGSCTGGAGPWQPRGRLGGFSEESDTDGDLGRASGLVLHVAPVPVFSVSELRNYKAVPVLAKSLCYGVTNHQISLIASRPNRAAQFPLAIPAHPHPPTPQRRTRNGLAGEPTRNRDARCALLAWLSAVHSTHKLPEPAHHHGASCALYALSLAGRRTLSFSEPAATLDAAELASVVSGSAHTTTPHLVPLIRQPAAPSTDWVC